MVMEMPLTSPGEAARYRAEGLWRDDTIYERFAKVAVRMPEKVAIIDGDRKLTYGEIDRLVTNIAGNILDLGFNQGEVFAVQSKNAPELALMHLALNRIGLLYMPLHDSWRETELRHLLKRARARGLVVMRDYRGFDYPGMVAEIRGELPDLRQVYVLGGAQDGFRDFAELTRQTRHDAADLAAQRPDPDAPASIMLSGGTTSISKISRFNSNDLVVLLDTFAKSIGYGENEIAAALAPAGTGATGYIYPILTPLVQGGTAVIQARWDPVDAVDLIVRHRCTYGTAIPTQLTLMIPAIEERKPQDFAAFRVFSSAGAPLAYETASRIEAMMGCLSHSIYGATDGGVPTMTSVTDPPAKRLRSVGRPQPGYELEIRDPSGKALPPGEAGEIVWRGPDKSWGYLGDDETTAQVFTADRFYLSGDLGEMDEAGYLRVVGRLKDMILRGGRNVSPRVSEELLIKHPAVLEVAVAPMPDPVLGERACAFVQLRAGRTLNFEEMVAFLKAQKIAIWQLPERLEIVEEFQRGPGGKITKSHLTAWVTEKLNSETPAAR